MTNQPQTLLPELPEDRATGEIATIYDEIRRCSGVTYVSSLQRYLATMPGVLEWVWAALRPAMQSGTIPNTGWRLAETVRGPQLRPVSPETLSAWGIDDAGLAAIRNVAANFHRVSPVNLMMGACLKILLTSLIPDGPGFNTAWSPPTPLPPMRGNVEPLTLPADPRAVLLRFATEVDGMPFVPALYRQLAHWPRLLAWLADELAPLLTASDINATRAAFRAAAAHAAPAIVARLPGSPTRPSPDAGTIESVLATIDRYAVTSPEMTMFGQALLTALPLRSDQG